MMNPPNPSAEADDILFHGAERRETAYFMRRLYRQFLTTTSGGNISCRLPDGNIAITASQSDKAEQSPETVGITTPDGKSLTGELKLSIETGMHLAVYRARPEVEALVHAHPPLTTAFTLTDRDMNEDSPDEVKLQLGRIVKAKYGEAGSAELAQNVAEAAASGADAVLLARHGALTTGADPLRALFRMESLEQAAKTMLAARLLQL